MTRVKKNFKRRNSRKTKPKQPKKRWLPNKHYKALKRWKLVLKGLEDRHY